MPLMHIHEAPRACCSVGNFHTINVFLPHTHPIQIVIHGLLMNLDDFIFYPKCYACEEKTIVLGDY